jgi:hypothetical protein
MVTQYFSVYKNYRPISMIPCDKKMFKKVILTRLDGQIRNFVSHTEWFPEGLWNQRLCSVAFDGHPNIFRVQAADFGGVFGHHWSMRSNASGTVAIENCESKISQWRNVWGSRASRSVRFLVHFRIASILLRQIEFFRFVVRCNMLMT